MKNTHLSSLESLLDELKNTSEIEKKYEILLSFNSFFDQYDSPSFKNADNIFGDCTVRIWLFEVDGVKVGYSESRLINGLLYLIINNVNHLTSIEDIIKYYSICFFYSNMRINSLKKVFDHLTI